MKILLSFICLSLSLTMLVGCGDETKEVKDVGQPGFDDTVKPESEDVDDSGKLEDKENAETEPTPDAGNVFNQLLKDQDNTETKPTTPTNPTIPTSPTNPVNPTNPTPDAGNVFNQLLKDQDNTETKPTPDAGNVFNQLLNE